MKRTKENTPTRALWLLGLLTLSAPMMARQVLKAQDAPVAPSAPVAAKTSALWGENGERWDAASRLPDFSFAGYHNGEASIPDVPIVANVRDFGAKGDGETDDAPAFQRAIDATAQGAILIPTGRYVLGSVVRIEKSNIVLRGAGVKETILLVPKPLSEIDARPNREEGKTYYSFSGGFLTVAGKTGGASLSTIEQPALRGARTLTLTKAVDIAPGTWVRLQMSDDAHTLGRYLHADQDDAGVDTYKSLAGKPWISWVARVTRVQGREITFDRPLRLDVRLAWKPELYAYEPTVQEVGLEHFSFEFPGRAKAPHLKEEGFNAVQLSGIANCWVRDVQFTDADNGVIVGGSRFCTVENTRFMAAKREGLTGHHALWATGSQECLFQQFRFDTTYVHDLTVEGRATGNVFRDGSGVSLNFDHHRNAPYENLFTNLDVGNPKRIWDSSGREDRGPHSGARATFWNIRAEKGKFGKVPDWPQINIIGVGSYASSTTTDHEWIEPLTSISPPDLYLAQRARRAKQ